MNVSEDADGVTFDVLVQPRASRAKVGPEHDGRLKVAVTAPPVDGEANAAVVELVAKALGVGKRAVEVVAGASSRRKTLRVTGVARAAVLALATICAACNGESGTIKLSLVEPVGMTHVGHDGDVDVIRVTLTSPREAHEATRNASGGFDLGFDVDASGDVGRILIEGFANGQQTPIVVGESPLLPIQSIDANIAIYVAPPNSLTVSPTTLLAARSDMTVVALSAGAAMIGGLDANGIPSKSVELYNAFSHTDTGLVDLIDARVGMAAAVTNNGQIVLFGGAASEGGAPTNDYWRIDPAIPPSGSITMLDVAAASLARDHARALPLGADTFIVSGTPAASLAAGTNAIAAITDPNGAMVAPTGASVVASDGVVSAVFVDGANPASGLVIFHGEAVSTPAVTSATVARTGHAITGLPGGDAAVLGGADTATGTADADIVRLDVLSGEASIARTLAPRFHAAVASTDRFLLSAGGTDDAVGTTALGTADLLDSASTTLDSVPLTVDPEVVRIGGAAIALPTEQILVIGGVDAAGAPVGQIQLFTPALPAD